MNGNDGIQERGVFWEDLRFPATRIRQGATAKPDFDVANIGLLFPQNDEGEIAYIIAQMPHSKKIGTDLHPHIHFVQTGATAPVFNIDYRIYNNGSDPTGAFTTSISTSAQAFTYSAGSILQISMWPDIDMSTESGVSSMVEIKLYRETGDGVAGDVLVKEFDFHYQTDYPGSVQEYTK